MSRFIKTSAFVYLAFSSFAFAETVSPLSNPGVTVESMAELLAGPGVAVSGAAYYTSYYTTEGPWYNRRRVENLAQGGQFSGYGDLFGSGFQTGVILSTGDISSVTGENSSPQTNEAWDRNSVDDTDLGSDLYDVVKFSFDVVPDNEVLVIDFIFGSDEYLEFVGASYNDLARILVNGTNCALTPAGDEVRINNIHSLDLPPAADPEDTYPNNADGISNAGIYVNNTDGALVTEMDGFTRQLSCRVAVTPGEQVRVVTGLADVGDAQLDTWIFFRADSIRSEPISDFGDAPDSYGTLSASGGAAHDIVEGVRLGAVGVTGDIDGFVDGVNDSQGNALDDADNALATVPSPSISDINYSLTFAATSINGSGSEVVGWIDFDRDGQFQPDEAAPLISVANDSYETPITLNWSGIGASGPDIKTGPTYLRLRIANMGLSASTPAGAFASGEVEDYRVIISDGQNPAIATILRQSPADMYTGSSSVTFRVQFSEYVEGVDSADFSVTLGSITQVELIEDNVFDVTVSGMSGVEGELALSLSGSQDIVDAEGNLLISSLPVDAESYQIDQSAPAAPTIDSISTDTGRSADDGITADNTLMLSGSAEAGSQISLRVDGAEVATTSADSDGNWLFDYSGAVSPDGTYQITAVATDQAGNVSAVSEAFVVVIDTQAPGQPTVLTISEDTGASSTDAVTNDAQLMLSGEAGSDETVTLYVDGVLAGTAYSNEFGFWMADISGVVLSEGTRSIAATATDAAGNVSAISAPLIVTVDQTSPDAPVITAISDDTGEGGDGVTSDNTLRLFGTAEVQTEVAVFQNGTLLSTVTADGNGDWVYDLRGTTLADGDYSFTAQSTDLAGNTSDPSLSFAVTIDTSGPATPVVQSVSEDTGVVDGITADQTLIFGGSADVGDRVAVFLNGQQIGAVTASDEGIWTFDYSTTLLSDGDYSVTAQATSLNGLTSPMSAVYNLTIDTIAPDSPSVSSITTDTGLDGDWVTADNTLIFSGTAEAGADLDVRLDGALIGMLKANEAGEWILDYSATVLDDGEHLIAVTATDAAGNTGSESTPLAFTIDTQPPVLPVVSGISDDTGSSASDGITRDSRLLYVGTAEAGTAIDLLIDGSTVGSVTADASGQWSVDLTETELAEGQYDVVARSRDLAGNSTDSAALAITVDLTAPEPAVVTSIDEDTKTPNDRVTSDTELAFSGVSEPGSVVEIFINGQPSGLTTADETGAWSFDYSDVSLADGVYAITNQVTDLAGNTGGLSSPVSVIVDTVAPQSPMITAISDDTGTADDGITSDTTLTFSGSSEAGSEVDVYLNDALIGNVITDASGEWVLDYTSTELTDGNYSVDARATDVAGNVSARGQAFELEIDTVAPGNVTLSQNGQTIADNTPVLSGTADPGSRILITINGAEFVTQTNDDGEWSIEITPDIENGDYDVEVVSEDSAGNQSSTSGSITVDLSISRDNSQTSAAPTTVAADGVSVALIRVEIRDTANELVPGLIPTISTSLGQLSDVTEVSNGVYEAELSSSFDLGTATVDIEVADTALESLTVNFIAGDSDGDGLTDLDEDANNDGDPTNDDLDRDGIPDYRDDDDDGDGRTTSEEDVNGDGDPTNDDTDGDGIPDYLDGDDDSTDGTNDSDGDGVSDTRECTSGLPCEDTDADGTPDYMDEDDDNDGIPTKDEGVQNSEQGESARDSDGDGIPDYLDSDDDGDGLLTRDEDADEDGDANPATQPGPDADADGIPAYLDPNDNDTSGAGDSDGDGIPDDQECANGLPCEDTDADGVPDYRDEDDDNDGIPTLDEGPLRDTDGDGTPDFRDPDDDGDGVISTEEDANTDGDGNPATTPGLDVDNDGIPAYLDPNDSQVLSPGDADDDGVTDDVECAGGLPCRDTDGDGVPDYMDDDDDGDGIPSRDEGDNRDSDGDGVPDRRDNDDDNDGRLTTEEDGNSDLDNNPATEAGPDADGDGIPAYLDPNDDEDGVGDSDGDGLPDDLECGPALPCRDSDFDGIPDFRDDDDDGDGVPTASEAPMRDSDGDGIPDYLDPDDDDDGIPTPLEDSDLDGDGNAATQPGPDADGDNIPAYLDPNDGNSSSPGDGDGDSLPDNVECPTGIPCVDSDFDGVPNYMDEDDDGDGVLTRDEDANRNGDLLDDDGDNDGVPDYLDPDSTDDDEDGLSNLEEDSNGDGDPTNDDLDRDGIPDYLDPDDDGDGFNTIDEDLNGNGDPRDDDGDGDGIPAYLDPNDQLNGSPGDADEDGIFDDIECDTGIPCRDTDGDGLPDYMDGDDDNDGVPSAIEGRDRDTDNDGTPDFRDPDDDGDGIATGVEDSNIDGDGNPSTNAGPDFDNDTLPAYLDPNDSDVTGPGDSDGDSLSDLQECRAGAPCEDSDQDGQPDYNDPDDDNDGRNTITEDPNEDGNPANDDTDGDGIADYLDRDDDGDGRPSDEESNGDADNDGIPDYLDRDGNTANGTGGDSDNDGINDVTECPSGVPCRDTDGDGSPDYADDDDDNDGRSTLEEGPDRDTDGDGTPDNRDPDDDGDGFDTIDEGSGDSDGDGIPDYLDPSAGDSDNDGVPDGAECPDGVPCRDTDGNGVPDYLDEDDDGDGVPTVDEDLGGDGNPTNDDTDGDGIPDYLDRDDDEDGLPTLDEGNNDRDGDGIPDYLDPDDANLGGTTDGSGDSDRDGVSDRIECPLGVPCRDSDSDGTPDYLSPDDDGDGIPTIDEDRNGDGNPLNDDTDNDFRPDYRDPDDDGDGIPTSEENEGDSDFDGIPDYLDPSSGDSDRDGISDAIECPGLILCWDTDGDDLPNFRDPDDDGDGVPTEFEDADGDGNPRNDDTDNDGIPDYLDTDDDNDGTLTGDEGGAGDIDNDGIPDYLDPDSNNAAGMPDGSGDSDGDGISDREECGTGSRCADTNGDGTPDYMQIAEAADADLAPGLVEDLVPGKGEVSASLPALGSMTVLWSLLSLPLVLLRRSHRSKLLATGVALLLGTGLISAKAQAGFDYDETYAGASIGLSRLTPSTSDSVYNNEDESGTGFGLFAGYRLEDDLSLELQYSDLGEAVLKDGTTDEEASFGYSVLGAMLHWYPWQTSWNGKDTLNAYLEAGLVSVSTDSSVDYNKEASMSLGLGVGIEYSFADTWAARISGQTFTRDAHYLGLSFMKRFGSTAPVPVKRPVVKPAPVAKPKPIAAPVVIMADSDNDGIVDDIDDCPDTPDGMSVNHRGCSVLDARLDGVYFASGSSELTTGATRVLDQVIDTLFDYPDARIEIGAYTDSLGAAAANQRLSERRANAVMQYLIDMGVRPTRLEARGYGEEDPIASNDTPQGRAQNRRVEIRVIN